MYSLLVRVQYNGNIARQEFGAAASFPNIFSKKDYPGSDPMGVTGRADFGENYIYLSRNTLDEKMATSGEYTGTGKTKSGGPTLERTSAHEFGHTSNLRHADGHQGNLMVQTGLPEAGMEIIKQQILFMIKDYEEKKLNKGRQQY